MPIVDPQGENREFHPISMFQRSTYRGEICNELCWMENALRRRCRRYKPLAFTLHLLLWRISAIGWRKIRPPTPV